MVSISYSGADKKVNIPFDVMANSSPEIVKVTSLPSTSIAVTVPTDVWPSRTLK